MDQHDLHAAESQRFRSFMRAIPADSQADLQALETVILRAMAGAD
jgi:hypothetical protein